MDHLGVHTLNINNARKFFIRGVSEVACSPPYHIDPRTHLIGPYVSLRKVQKHQELGRLEALEKRRRKLKKLIECDRQGYMCELLEQGLTLYTDTLF